MSTQSNLSRLYRRTSVREKALIFGFIAVMLLIWGNSWLGRFSDWRTQSSTANAELKSQQQWLAQAQVFESGLARALERVDPSKTYNSQQLSGQIDTLLRQANLSANADLNPVRTREGEIFNDHNIRVRLSRISISQLIQFNELIKRYTPYITMESVRISKNRNRPEELDARFEINSFELKDTSL
ncbi:hypothetical protein [Coraliomargarita parva]|uniref:hypothetical protein n=1 Tax=Coraliomargarita parva TaxID=3014050 RepID=UPI0022B589DA|nr:hypothetical protein [Coraliomargarita parva]